MPPVKRKRSSDPSRAATSAELPTPPFKRRSSARTAAAAAATNPDCNSEVIDAPDALRASPDSDINENIVPGAVGDQTNGVDVESSLSEAPDTIDPPVSAPRKKGRAKKAAAEGTTSKAPATPAKRGQAKKGEIDPAAAESKTPVAKARQNNIGAEPGDPEADVEEDADPEEINEALSRPPPVNSDYLPLPWKGRLGYCCLNTYLRNSNPPIFSSRTCRIQSILEHRHPLQDPTQPEHPTKNRPDKERPADIALGQKYVEALGLANVKDINKMVRWNDRYNIKFFRLSSEMFPFASHPEYGYKLAPFASEALAEAGRTIAQYGHRVTTHPGQFTQLGSPRKSVIDNAIRDLEYHDELLSLLKLPGQLNRNAVMILHMGGLFEGKEETLQRFREHYANLKQSIKNRLVLENDDVIWSVHDLLPVCEELNIPMVLDYHHHNIIFDSDKIREGTKDIMDLYPRIAATWSRKGIKQKMHYSEPTPQAITGRQRRKHNPRVASMPPCAPDMDLMIEAKDKEQAVFELMRTFKLPGYDTFNDILPYARNDDNKVALQALNKKKNRDEEPLLEPLIAEQDIGMGGPEGRVYWPPTMEEWLRPKKKEVKKKDTTNKNDEAMKEAAALYAAREAEKKAAKAGKVAVKVEESDDSDPQATPATKKAKAAMRKKAKSDAEKAVIKVQEAEAKAANKIALAEARAALKQKPKVKMESQALPTPSSSSEEPGREFESHDDDEEDEAVIGKTVPRTTAKRPAALRAATRRSAKANISYNEDIMEE